jgi:hypothetical protein
VPNGGRLRQTTDQTINGQKRQLSLETAAAQWPTPEAACIEESLEAKTARNERLRAAGHAKGCGSPRLATVASQQQWATPRNTDPKCGHSYTPNMTGKDLSKDAKQWQTIQAQAGTKRRLNPRFVAWLMGFPVDWCAELPRVDQLRCYGNAVVPAQGAYALTLLR